MRNSRLQRGSALLIVLGMLSFMVVSAVAFSAFMRQGRMPSSFLRQKILARQLVKAGLAQAMAELDEAIGSDPYPNERSDGFPNASQMNYWRNRVYLGYTGNGFEGYSYETGLKNTVSTFPLEGLAYIPAPLVNTLRHWSRRSSAAEWKSLDYDSGRWAFSALNVSDYLDINRLRANVMRDSSPSNRISLAFLFEDESHGDCGQRPKLFDDFIDKSVKDGTYGRLISLADYSLAAGFKKYGDLGIKSPFYEYIKNPAGDGSFYGSTEEEAKVQKFVTDSWFPGTNTVSDLVLTDPVNGQPFVGKNESFDELQKNGGSRLFTEIIREHLGIVEIAALYDYLDDNNIPISLALPTIERAPMLTGLRLDTSLGGGIKVELGCDESQIAGKGGAQYPDIIKTWKINGLGSSRLQVSGCGVYPFKRKSGLQSRSYRAQVMVKMFFSDSELVETRIGNGFRPTKWANEDALASQGYVTVVRDANVRLSSQGPLKDDETKVEIDAVEIDVPDTFRNRHVYGVREPKELNADGNPITKQPVWDSSGMSNPLIYLQGNTTVRSLKEVQEANLRLNFVCWVRILDGNDTVDLVPATFSDDQTLNNHQSGSETIYESIGLCSSREPIIPCGTGNLLELSLANANTPTCGAVGAPEQAKLSIYCDDPRYNYAPEDWYSVGDADVRFETWLQQARSRCDGNDRRPNDIFQFVSDQDYLQSMGELQFLPFTKTFRAGNPMQGEFYSSGKYDGKPFAQRTDPTMLANRNFAWKTHWGFGRNADWDLDGEDCSFYEWGVSDTNGGAVISPYADEDLFMAALANTPYDYIVAAEKENESDKDLDKQYELCFNEASSEARLEWTKLKEIAKKIREKLRNGNEDWEEWDEWEQDSFFGQAIDNFDDVDRKFLFSYWKPCFANSQQLFLVFVRAEPTVIGGASAGHTPSQLGARAVALVWREPVSTVNGASRQNDGQSGSSGNDNYHRMRVLFYHQFD